MEVKVGRLLHFRCYKQLRSCGNATSARSFLS
eukprot:SAG31_NODE_43198_length_268_cov_0.609467_1_plen_31_part_10